VRRREFISVLGGAAVWPLAGHTQQSEQSSRVGVLIGFPRNDPFIQTIVKAFVQALGRLGWVEGKNLRIDYRFAAGDPALLKTDAEVLVGLSPNAILASPGAAATALQQETHAIPIVFVLLPDPVGQGLVQSLARPGGNLTGFASYDPALMGKWLQLLKEIAPSLARVTAIFNPDTSVASLSNRAIEAAAPSVGVTVALAPVHDNSGIEEAISTLAREPGGGLIILPDSFNETHRDAIITAATRHGLPLIGTPTFPRAGGLLSYMFDPVELHAEAAKYVDRVLKGASPADLPVQYPTKYSLIINLKTAKALGLTVPPGMLDLADEVIE